MNNPLYNCRNMLILPILLRMFLPLHLEKVFPFMNILTNSYVFR